MDYLDIKARELVIKFQFKSPPLKFDEAKQCASICINEILLHLEEFPQFREEQIQQQNYLQALNDKIQKL